MPGKRYDPLKVWLSQQEQEPSGIKVNFRDIEVLLGGALPAAAKKHQSWWSSNPHEAQSQAWLEAGWRVSEVNLARREVTFQPTSVASTPAPQAATGPATTAVGQNRATAAPSG
ncbi:MAG: hypothetical protein M3328_14740 [Chloroflexota bacterium]|nr:hypothetical protein [Chloroflexota bacterium]